MTGNTTSFTDLKLLPGQTLQLEFEGYTSDRDRSTLIGYKPNASLIVTTPLTNGVAVNIKNKEKVNVRFFANRLGCACAFSSEVISASKSPYPHMHLKIPEKVITGEVRGSVRAEVELMAQVEFTEGDKKQYTSAKIIDLSNDGARMIGKKFDLESGDKCRLIFTFNIAELEYEIKLNSIARTFQKLEQGISVGLQFENVPDAEKIALQAFVLSKLHQL